MSTSVGLPEVVRCVQTTLDSLTGLSDAELQAPEAVGKFRQTVQRIADHVRDLHEIGESTRHIFSLTHYTSLEVLFGMLRDSGKAQLRLYDAVHLNDPREGVTTPEGQTIGSALLDQHRKETSYTGPIGQDHVFSRFATGYVLSFVADFAGKNEIGDNLIFWRLYGRNGEGCSITFWPFSARWPDTVSNQLRQVSYDTGDGVDFSVEILQLLSIFHRLGRVTALDHGAQGELAQAIPLLEECLAKRFLTKDPSYQAESEVRLVRFARPRDQPSPREPHVELVRGVIRHYLDADDLKLENLVNTRTILRVGPAVPHPQDAKHALRRLWDKSGLPPIRIETSSIEYRPSR